MILWGIVQKVFSVIDSQVENDSQSVQVVHTYIHIYIYIYIYTVPIAWITYIGNEHRFLKLLLRVVRKEAFKLLLPDELSRFLWILHNNCSVHYLADFFMRIN